MTDVRTHYIDASAIVKILVDEPGCIEVREYFDKHAVFVTTPVCFCETLGVLKLKRLRGILDQEGYLAAAEELMGHVRGGTLTMEDVGIVERPVFDEVERLATKHTLDISDSYQLVTLRLGMFASFSGDSIPILVTADEKLAAAARLEGLRVWDCLRAPAP